MQHTRFTLRSYTGFSTVMLTLGIIAVGFGAIDLLMIAPLGLDHVAAVGQGELVVSAIYAFLIGVIDVFSSRLAVAEGNGSTAQRMPVLVVALLMLLVLCELGGIGVIAGLEPLLSLLGQDPTLIPLVGDYVAVRTYGIAVVIMYSAISEAMKICGLRNRTFPVLIFGLGVNGALNWLFLYTDVQRLFPSPESAVATATVAAQVAMSVSGAWILLRQMRARAQPFIRPDKASVRAEFGSMARTAPGVGARHLNDYAGTIIPLMFIGTIGVKVLAAVVVAAKIYTMICRVPQACFSGTFVFYGYALGGGRSGDLSDTIRKLRLYAAVPTAVVTLAALALSPWLVGMFSTDGLDQDMARYLLFAYLLYMPAYFFEQFYGEMLTVRQRGGLLFSASTVVTYLLTVPMAWYSLFVLKSPFLAVASKGLSTAVLALMFWITLRKDQWDVVRRA